MNDLIVVGNGLIAKCFRGRSFNKKVLIFASGVSNSKEVNPLEFEREEQMLVKALIRNPDASIVYFSSTGLCFDIQSAYFEHKKNMERLVSDASAGFYIFRLPQVVGPVDNNTLVSYLTKSLLKGAVIDVAESAVRNLIAIDDTSRIVCQLLNGNHGFNTVQTLASGSNVRVWDVVYEISLILDVHPRVNLVDDGDDQAVEIGFLDNVLHCNDPIFAPDYWRHILKTYVPRIVNEAK